MSDYPIEHVEEALKMREEVQKVFAWWRNICDDAEVILEAKRFLERERRRSFHHDAEDWDETGRTLEKVK